MENSKIKLLLWKNLNSFSYSISSLLLSKNSIHLITGDLNGNVILWKFFKNQFIKKMFLLAHNSKITSIIEIIYFSEKSFITVSIDGFVAIWKFKDGLCLKLFPNLLSCSPKIIKQIPNHLFKFVAVGESNIIEIFDIEKSQVIQVLYGHDTWISSVYLSSFQVNEYTLMISLGNDGKLCFWKFDPNSNDNQNQNSDQFLLRRVTISIENIISSTFSPNEELFLVVSDLFIQIYDCKGVKIYYTINCLKNEFWKDAYFLDSFHIVAFTRYGKCFIYQIPKLEKENLISLSQAFLKADLSSKSIKTKNTRKSNDSNLLKMKKSKTEPNISSNIPHKQISFNFFENLNSPSILAILNQKLENGESTIFANYNSKFIISGDSSGSISLWKWEQIIQEVNQFYPKKINITSLSKNINENENERKKDPFITSTLFFEKESQNQILIINGYSNGEITVKYFPLSSSKPIKFIGDHSDRIITLFVAEFLNKNKSEYYLISVSKDYIICVWDLTKKIKIATFSHHIALIKYIIQPSKNQNLLLFIDEDNVVSICDPLKNQIFHILGHSKNSKIVKIYWEKSSLNLGVEFENCLLYFWNLRKGKLDRVIENQNQFYLSSFVKYPQNYLVYTRNEKQNQFVLEQRKTFQKNLNFLSFSQIGSGYNNIILLDIVLFLETMIRRLKQGKVLKNKFQLIEYFIELDNMNIFEKSLKKNPNNQEQNIEFGLVGNSNTLTLFISQEESSLDNLKKNNPMFASIVSLLSVSFGMSLAKLPKKKYQILGTQMALNYIEKMIQEMNNQHLISIFENLFKYWMHSNEDIQQSSRSILQYISNQIEAKKIIKLTSKWRQNVQISSTKTLKANNLLLLGVLCLYCSNHVEKSFQSKIVSNLIKLVQKKEIQGLIAIELITTQFSSFKQYIPNIDQFIGFVFQYVLIEKNEIFFTTSRSILFSIGFLEPGLILLTLKNEIQKNQFTKIQFEKILSVIFEIVSKKPIIFTDYIFKIVEITLQIFPIEGSSNSDNLLKIEEIFHLLSNTYQIFAYHQEIRKILIGTESKVIFYDLNNSKIEPLISYHKSNITNVSFSPNGKLFASFSLDDKLLLIWKIKNSTFSKKLKKLTNLFKSIQTPDFSSLLNQKINRKIDRFKNIELFWTNSSIISLKIESNQYNFKIK
ncbi:rabconnectin-3b isoform a [Anaeramoeba ignava]|uniref:Rabconnectin-3b isoform a n=1 Tax=Anaeramoeba ignava TaxID=1746090 RepID=A0A9Q0LS35_ANAIG|nr:rabconnectin-3b isoform a [Anaeramoeba ignava]